MCSTPLQATISEPTNFVFDPRPTIVTSPSALSTNSGISASSASSRYRSSPMSASKSSTVSATSGTAWYASNTPFAVLMSPSKATNASSNSSNPAQSRNPLMASLFGAKNVSCESRAPRA